jgi:hypothetical protein
MRRFEMRRMERDDLAAGAQPADEHQVWRMTANNLQLVIAGRYGELGLGRSSRYRRDGPGPITGGDELDLGVSGNCGSPPEQRNPDVNEIVFVGQIGGGERDTVIRLARLVRPSGPFIERT